VPKVLSCVSEGPQQQPISDKFCQDWCHVWQWYIKGYFDCDFPELKAGPSAAIWSALYVLVRMHPLSAEDVAAFDNSAMILVKKLQQSTGVTQMAVARVLAAVPQELTGQQKDKFGSALISADFPRVVSELLNLGIEEQSQAAVEAMKACLALPLDARHSFPPVMSALSRCITRSPQCAGNATEVMYDILNRESVFQQQIGILKGLDLDDSEYAATL
jgi:hypothetical protein